MTAPQLSIDQVNEVISNAEHTLSSLPRSDPQFPPLFTLLGIARVIRYGSSDDRQDLDRSIIQLTHAVFLPFGLSVESNVNPIQAFFYLAAALFHRSHKFKQLDTVKYCVKYFRYLRDGSSGAFGVEYNDIILFLVRALALQVELESGDSCNGMQDIVEEISTLCFELFTSEVNESQLKTAVVGLSKAVAFFMASWNELSERVVECLREANRRLPNLHSLSIVLSMSLFTRFYSTKSHDDYKDAIATLDRIIASDSPAEIPGIYMREALDQAATLAMFRSNLDGNPEYLEHAILRYRDYLNKTPFEDPERPAIAQSLATLENTRFEEFGIRDGQERHFNDPTVDDPSSFSHLIASLAKSSTGKRSLMTLEDQDRHYNAVMFAGDITDRTDIGEAVKYCRLLLASLQTSPDNHLTYMTTIKLGDFFLHAFKLTHSSEYLNESIAIFRGMLEMPRAHWLHFDIVTGLIWSLSFRFLLSKDRKDLDEIMQLYPIAVTDSYTKISDRFRFSCKWAQYARAHKHPSTSIAYEIAASLMQDTLTFAPTLEIQHSRLVSMRDEYEELPLNHASYLIGLGHNENAIETLEQGRGLFWSEMRGFRTSIDQLRVVDSTLAEKFAAINRDLEALTTSISPDALMNDVRAESLSGMDPFGRLVVEQRKLLEERNSIITEIQALPGFEQFLMAPSFDTLRLLPHMDRDFYSRANQMRDELFGARREGLDSREYEDTLRSILAKLYDLVGRPVVERLNLLNVPEKSRIWWCPTSVFCSLPLHAMGPIRTDGLRNLYFSDLYIPSYTPTLSALIEARNPGAKSLQIPSILLVTQPDVKMPNALQEMRVVQAITTSVTSLTWETATPTATLEHLRDHQFLHISCHGKLTTGKPFDASFKLNQGTRLTLLDIVRSQLPNAAFAFLSACHTAEITEESIADEGLHLTAAVQYCGYRSVVGTMWAMADIDGPDLAGHFYRSVFSDKWEGIPYHERTAAALRVAVKSLRRKKNMTLERWVNFVHYGA
ncbi:CHAT domain-containing protein [Russula dissimulans]|nr:CHAT domain-containing protein [Russula dissimulans]